MRAPNFERFSKFIQMSGVFAAGMIVGWAVFTSIYHINYNHLVISNSLLLQENESLKQELKISQKFKGKQIISKLNIRIEQNIQNDSFTKLTEEEIKHQLEKDLHILIGRNIYDIDEDARLARLLLNGKRYSVEDRDYAVEIKTMLLVDKVLYIWVAVKAHI